MRANEYIKEHGLNKARELYNSDDWSTVSDVFLHDLKRLLESHELVEKYKGYTNPKWHFIADYCVKYKLSPFDSYNYGMVSDKYEQSITDVESCQ